MSIVKHRCFKIPKNRLDLFLTALYVNFSVRNIDGYYDPQAKYIFQNGDYYDVVVGFNKIWEEMEVKIEKYVEDVCKDGMRKLLEQKTRNHEVDCRCTDCQTVWKLRHEPV